MTILGKMGLSKPIALKSISGNRLNMPVNLFLKSLFGEISTFFI